MKLKQKLILVLIAIYSIFSVVFTITWLFLLADNEVKTDTKIRAEFLETSYHAINNIAKTYFQYSQEMNLDLVSFNPKEVFIEDIDGYIFVTDFSGNILSSNKQLPDQILAIVTANLISGFVNEFHIKNTKVFTVDNYQNIMSGSSEDEIPIKLNFMIKPGQKRVIAYGQLMYSTMARVDALNNLVKQNNWTLSLTGIAYLFVSLSILVFTIWTFFSLIIDRPLQKIVRTLQFGSKQESYIPMVSKIKDEIGDISRAFDSLQSIQNELINNIKQSEQNLTQIIDLIPSSIFARDIQGNYLMVNKMAADMSQLSVEEMVGQNAWTVNLDDHDLAEYLKEDKALIESGEATLIDTESIYQSSTGDRWMKIVKMPFIPVGGERSILCIMTDISRVKFAEQELQELNKSLEAKVEKRTKLLKESNKELTRTLEELKSTQLDLIKKEKMASLSVLTAGMAHELNTPIGICITAISHTSSVLKELNNSYERGGLTELKLVDFLSDVSVSAELMTKSLVKAADLIKNFKKLASNQAHSEIEKFDLISLIEDTLKSFNHKFVKNGITIKFDHPDNASLTIVSYVGSFTQVLTNLITNSLIHGQMEVGKGEINLNVYLSGDKVFISYEDNGVGVSDSVASKLFDPFFTTKRTQGGTGLGLHIVATLVENSLAGKIQCNSGSSQKGLSFLIEAKVNLIGKV